MLAVVLALAPLGSAEPWEQLDPAALYRVEASLNDPSRTGPGVRFSLVGAGGERIQKTLRDLDPDLTLTYRPQAAGPARVEVAGDAAIRWTKLDLPPADRDRFEAEPNDDWHAANPLTLGRDVFGSGDDVDEIDNPDEGRAGVDWFRVEVGPGPPVQAAFRLDLIDRDVSANIRVFQGVDGKPVRYEEGRDPTEVVHDREHERYSVFVTRTFGPGVYFVEVNANHAHYVLRSRTNPLPRDATPEQAAAIGLRYLLDAGDAWFAQIPRAGYATSRSTNVHDTAVRCTACHASSYPTEAALVGLEHGYPVESRDAMANLVARLANSPTPLYGDKGLYWQRFIAIPLQAQGKQGGILADYDRVLGHRPNPATERFVPFLRAAWTGREVIPADEQNGVVPADSKFAALWRDWRVLELAARRTGRVADARASDNIADILAEPATDARVETFQDRLHRLHAWRLVDRDRHANRIEDEVHALFALQNPDGGWNELGRLHAPSAVYATGQTAWELIESGVRRDDPRIRRALDFLRVRQQPFGGWFETTTHENFRTPMRETRYAAEALAAGYPRPGGPIASWGNRDGGPSHAPRPGPLAATLDDLDDLWDVPEPDRPHILPAVASCLDQAEPWVRAHAAAALGRVGDESNVAAVSQCLGDRSKVVRRAAAWALRTMVDRGVAGVPEAIVNAFDSADVRVRRGACRVFAAQFYGLDERADLADRLIRLTADADPEVRLQTLRSLRQWFYRTGDDRLRRRIVDAYLERMAVPDLPVIRRAQIEGMYILLDENLGGGVSLQRNLAALPERYRAPALEGRARVEREVLLGPLLAAIEHGNALQREAVVASFDGSFLPGRGYARRPGGAIDVGNDREFGFLAEPDESVLDRAFRALFDPAIELDTATRARAIRLAQFFRVGSRTDDPAVQRALLDGLDHPDPAVRAASRDAVADDLALIGVEADPDRLHQIVAALKGSIEVRAAVASAIARSPALGSHPIIAAEVRSQVGRDARGLAPVLRGSGFTGPEVVDAVARAWPGTAEVAGRLAWLDLLRDRAGVLDVPGTTEILRKAFADPATVVRERALNLAFESAVFRDGPAGVKAVLAALGDPAASVRRLAIGLGGTVPGFWGRAEAGDRLRALLADPDRECRERALGVVDRLGLMVRDPAIARRVRAMAAEPGLRERAEAVLRAGGIDPATVATDESTTSDPTTWPGLARFRVEVNPWLTRPGSDGASCRSCHANHGVFRIVEADPGRGVSESDAVAINYASALRVIDRADPESSRLVRKARSPLGQGAAYGSSPTGLSHAGGSRWDEPDHPAIRAVLGWVESAREGPAARPTLESDGHAPGFEPGRAGDGDPATAWRTEFVGATPGYPHDLIVDLGGPRPVEGLVVSPPRDGSAGRVRRFEVALSDDGKVWGDPVARGAWPDDPTPQVAAWAPGRSARFVRLRGLDAVDGGPMMSVAEVRVELSSGATGGPR